MASSTPKTGCATETLRRWVNRFEPDHGIREGLTTAEHERGRKLEREVLELHLINRILRKALGNFAQTVLGPNY